jgi:hypothetical protein|tara:strand:- start:257 stop:457 length:201 start_codon:yes stop_codon:yes gene_type:complete
MLSPLQIKRVLKHCERVDEDYVKMNMSGDEGLLYFDFMKNRGWCEALRLVLETNTFINDKEIEDGG